MRAVALRLITAKRPGAVCLLCAVDGRQVAAEYVDREGATVCRTHFMNLLQHEKALLRQKHAEAMERKGAA